MFQSFDFMRPRPELAACHPLDPIISAWCMRWHKIYVVIWNFVHLHVHICARSWQLNKLSVTWSCLLWTCHVLEFVSLNVSILLYYLSSVRTCFAMLFPLYTWHLTLTLDTDTWQNTELLFISFFKFWIWFIAFRCRQVSSYFPLLKLY